MLVLIERGDPRAAHDLIAALRQQSRYRLGEDHEHALMAARYLAWALLELAATPHRDLNQDTWTAGDGSWARTTPAP